MSVAATSWAWSMAKPADLSPTEVLVLLAIADHCNPQGYGFPSLPTVADMANVSESTARRAAKSLIERGLMTRDERWRTDGGRTSSAYQLAMPPPVKMTPPPVTATEGAPCHSCDTAPPVTGDRGILDPSERSIIEPAQARPFPLDAERDALRERLDALEFNTYVRALEAIQTDDEIRILASNDFVIAWLKRSGTDAQIRKMIEGAGEPRPVRFVVGSLSQPLYGGSFVRTAP